MTRMATLAYLGSVPPGAMCDGSLDYLEAEELETRLHKLREDDHEYLAELVGLMVKGIARVMR